MAHVYGLQVLPADGLAWCTCFMPRNHVYLDGLASRGFPKLRVLFRGSFNFFFFVNKGYSILGSPYFGKLPSS